MKSFKALNGAMVDVDSQRPNNGVPEFINVVVDGNGVSLPIPDAARMANLILEEVRDAQHRIKSLPKRVREQGNWYPAAGGTEPVFTSRSGRRLQYVYQPATGNHAYYDVDNDLILSDEEAAAYLKG